MSVPTGAGPAEPPGPADGPSAQRWRRQVHSFWVFGPGRSVL